MPHLVRDAAATASLIGALRNAPSLLRGVALLVLVTFLAWQISPAVLAAQTLEDAPPARQNAAALPASPGLSPEAQFSRVLQRLERRLATWERPQTQQSQTRRMAAANLDEATGLDEVSELRRQLIALDSEVMAGFAEVRVMLVDQQVPAEILARHDAMVAAYRAEVDRLLESLTDLETSPDANERLQAARDALAQLRERPHRRTPPPFNPNDLPNQSLPSNPGNKPKEDAAAFTQAGLHSNPLIRLAALGDFTFDQLPGASDPAYLAPTVEVTLSDAIRAKAAELNHDPIQIHNWVRNNVEWLPSWGAYQSAELTLGSRRGNAMDISSLLIALLRASQIPARYVHGTMELPAEQFRNWAGDFATVSAALDFVSAGGIPVTSVLSGGAIRKVRLEHIWVEAALDFEPSRGAVNKNADSWIALDPSFKQYEYLQGLDVLGIAGIDAEPLAQSFVDSGTINETEGWVTGFDPTVLENAQSQAQTELQQYIEEHLTDPTVGDVIGGRKAMIKEYPVLPSGLPYKPLVTGARYGALPTALQHRMSLAFQRDIVGDLVDPITLPWAQVNNQKLTLSFKPATEADEQALLALLPEGEITDPDQLPSSIPAYLIRVIPELRLNGTVIKQGQSLSLGEELSLMYRTGHPGSTDPAYEYKVIAGSYLVLPVIGQSVSPTLLQDLQQRLEATKTTLESNDQTLIATLTREALLGDLFYAGGLGYFAQYTGLSHVLTLSQRASHQLAFGYGSYGYEPNVSYFFGLRRTLEVGGAVMNIRIARQLGVHQTDPEPLRNLNLQIGALSSMLEHAIPEQMFVNDQNPGEAISAVKALAKANAAEQRMYHLTPANQSTTLPNIHHASDTMAEIRAALAAGLEVITHTDAVSVPGWSGAGYIIFDPVTGSGAYKISDGGNGGLLFIAGALMLFLGMWLVSSGLGAVAGAMLIYYGSHLIALGFALLMTDPLITLSGNDFLATVTLTYAIGLGLVSSFGGLAGYVISAMITIIDALAYFLQ